MFFRVRLGQAIPFRLKLPPSRLRLPEITIYLVRHLEMLYFIYAGLPLHVCNILGTKRSHMSFGIAR